VIQKSVEAFYPELVKFMNEDRGGSARANTPPTYEITPSPYQSNATQSSSIKSTYEISSSDLEQGRFLGSGAFGDVYRGTYQRHTPVAMKVLKGGSYTTLDVDTRTQFEAEMEIWGTLPFHDNGEIGRQFERVTSNPYLQFNL
jgi:hypothetical protein